MTTRRLDSDIVPPDAVPDALEDASSNRTTQNEPVSAHRPLDILPAHVPTETSDTGDANTGGSDVAEVPELDRSGHAGPTPPVVRESPRTSQPDRLGAQDVTHTSQPDRLGAYELTRTSQRDLDPSQAPTHDSQPIPPVAHIAPSPPSLQLRVPQLRDPTRYQMLEEHGRGGIGKVSRAHDLELGRDVAIKELLSRSPMHEVRFMREALITARLEHPSIVPVHEAGRWPDGTPFYAMKLVAGRPLRDLLAERTTIEDRLTLLDHLIAVADAIAYAHGRNIIHRDLKPGNVIIGDFGETVVIDWGLAKDLSDSDELASSAGPLPIGRSDDLTSAGAILGTPAYMAPEQRRGEPVGPRADVYAIGAMLWELCSLEKLPPSENIQRGRSLGHTSIDPDLIAIINKALATDPEHRYPDAAGLAADLRAFRAGARIAARRYSLIALIAHWTRRHRALALSTIIVALLTFIGFVLYVRGIAFERDRVRDANDALVLQQAQLLMRTDPTAAFALLSTYHGSDTARSVLLRAEAQGLGLAHLRATPHAQNIIFAQRLANDMLVTLGADKMVAKTSLAGTSRIIAQGVIARAIPAYSVPRGWLAYVCDTTAICILDAVAERLLPPPELLKFTPFGLAFSPNGNLLAAISVHGDAAIWEIGEAERPRLRLQVHLDHGTSLAFIDDATLVAQADNGIYVLRLDASIRLQTAPRALSIPAVDELAASGENHLVAVTSIAGDLIIVDGASGQVVDGSHVCDGQFYIDVVLHSRSAVAFACQNGDVGFWDIAKKSRVHLMHVDGGASAVASSADDRYVIVGGVNGCVIVYDTNSRMAMSYLGHSTRVGIVQPPTADFPYILSGDVSGELRTWPVPPAPARVALQMTGRMFRAMPLAGGGPVIAIGASPTVAWSRGPGETGALPGHHPAHDRLVVARQYPHFAAYGFDDELELGSFDSTPYLRSLRSRHGTIVGAAYSAEATRLIVACRDGSLEEWSSDGGVYRYLGAIREPISLLVGLPGSNAVVVVAASGALWLFDQGNFKYLGTHPGTIAAVAASPDSGWLAVASSRGEVRLYDLRTQDFFVFSNPYPSTQYMAFTPDGAVLAIATNESISLRPLPHKSTRSSPGWGWRSIMLPATHLGFSPNGDWFAAISDHGAWFYLRRDNRWAYFSTGTTKLTFGYFSADNRRFVATDMSGRALVFDMGLNLFGARSIRQ